jgi:hypothetical protein
MGKLTSKLIANRLLAAFPREITTRLDRPSSKRKFASATA